MTQVTLAGTKGPARKTIACLILTALMNSMGMMIIEPVLPFIVRPYISNSNDLATMVGWLSAIYAVCQFLAAPGLGLLSDRYGRRPILLICLLGSAIGYILFGIGGALWVFFLSRIIDGITGGNFSILFAYIADVIEPEQRGKYFGMFGAISGIGLILGPAIGGFLATFGYAVPAYAAAGITIATMLLYYFFLPESLHAEHRKEQIRLTELNPFTQLGNVFSLPQIRLFILVGAMYALPFAFLATNIGVLGIDSLGLTADAIGLLYLSVGVTDIVVQGVLVGRLQPILGDVKLAIIGLVLQCASYIMIGAVAFIASPVLLVASIILFAGSGGLIEPSLAGLLSRATDPRDQGRVQGGSQGLQALARVFGPVAGSTLYVQYGHATPYLSGAVIVGLMILTICLAAPTIQARPVTRMASEGSR